MSEPYASIYQNIKRTVTGLGLFSIEQTSPRVIDAGGTARFTIRFVHQKDGPVAIQSIAAKIYVGQNRNNRAQVGTTPTIYEDKYGIGSYFFDFNVPTTQGAGAIYAEWTGSYQSSDNPSGAFPVIANITLRVVQPSAIPM